MKYICTLIAVENIKKSRYLYEILLDQKVKFDFGENITFHGDFAIHKKEHFKELINRPVKEKSNNFELYFEDENLELIFDKLRQEGFEFIHEITEQPWKQRVLRFYDYDKNIVEIGEPLEYTAFRLSGKDYSFEEISRITFLPLEAVKAAIEKYQ
jgi:catechol 2,3-dioxygenase-like lactoylglutathione lyase family enzyme